MDLNFFDGLDLEQPPAEWLEKSLRILIEPTFEKFFLQLPLNAEKLEDGGSFTLEGVDAIGVGLELFYERLAAFDLGIEIEAYAGSHLDSVLGVLVGVGQLTTVINSETHRPIATAVKGGLHITRGVILTTLVGLMALNPHVAAAIASTMIAMFAIESCWRAEMRLNNFAFWLQDSLSHWIWLEKKIMVLCAKIEERKKQLNPDLESNQPKFYALLCAAQELQITRLARMKLDSFILKKEITCTIAYHVSENKNLEKIQNTLNVVQKKLSGETNPCQEAVTRLLALTTVHSPLLEKQTEDQKKPAIEKKIQKQAKAIIGTVDQETRGQAKKHESKIKEVERYNDPNQVIDFKEEYEKIGRKNNLSAQKARHKLGVCTLAMVGAILLALALATTVAINPLIGSVILGVAAGLFFYMHRKTIKNTADVAASYLTNTLYSFFSNRVESTKKANMSAPGQVFAKK